MAVRGLYVHLEEPERRALSELAEREWRRPSEQAGLLLAEALRQHGLLPDEPQPDPDARPVT